ncbi:hypothetical protein [Bacillus paramobilis]|uniref:hypothetical protein n=1 Tax=Bacillus paramobilis TaxID=2817477 RepID=UPI001BB45579|nr:hypothetical protein [Bacillus paramobilis]HEF5065752.1 hypothetical protein [Bacillus cereus]HEF5237823.1 hypothetical protein [Bacillus cereus]
MRHLTTSLVIVGGIIGAATGTTDDTSDQVKSPVTEEKVDKPKNKVGINKEEFVKIQNGMTLDEVRNIIGNEGELQSEAGEGEYKSSIYGWEGERGYGSNASVTFQDGKVTGKAQFGLK